MDFKQFMNGPFKKIEPWVNLVFFIFLAIAGGMAISACKGLKAVSSIFGGGGTGGYTVFQVFYWLVAVVAFALQVMKIVEKMGFNPDLSKLNQPAPYSQQQPQANPYQQQPAQIPSPVQNAAPAQNQAGSRFCTNCGAQVPAGNAFCTGCGAKMN